MLNNVECDDIRWRRHGAGGGLSTIQFENEDLAQGNIHITRVKSERLFAQYSRIRN